MLSAANTGDITLGCVIAVDADHIAAIDTVTRKLMQQGKNAFRRGGVFIGSFDHCVVLACLAIVVTSMAFRDRIDVLHQYGFVDWYGCFRFFLLAMAL